MADMVPADKRRALMKNVKGKNSQAELLVFRYLRANKIYFQRHYKRAAGSPDIALPRKRKAVFIDGDFWHGRKLSYLLERHGEDNFWTKKIRANMERDKRQRNELLQNGWSIIAVWESDLMRKRTREATLLHIANFLTSGL
ncbi:MAG TPA: very short patch repair endonuclease [Candidatus Saccharimonadales bacterium]|nr:very short patch repair endonuclease [Candidatus Saccharimonadales bacterium]